MTYLEKVREIYPWLSQDFLLWNACPDKFFMIPKFECIRCVVPCYACWNEEYKGEEVVK